MRARLGEFPCLAAVGLLLDPERVLITRKVDITVITWTRTSAVRRMEGSRMTGYSRRELAREVHLYSRFEHRTDQLLVDLEAHV